MAVGKNYDEVIEQMSFYGGISGDRKIGIRNSYADAMCLDIRKSPSQVSVLPQGRAVDGESVLEDVPIAMVQIPNGDRFVLDTKSNLYRDKANVALAKDYSNPNPEDVVSGLYYDLTQDTLFWPKMESIVSARHPSGTITPVEFSNSMDDGRTVRYLLDTNAAGRIIGGGIERWSFKNGSSGTYNVPTSLSEADADKARFIPTITPLCKFYVMFRAKPSSGTVTLYVHDGQNHQLAAITKNAAQITAGAEAEFDLSDALATMVYNWHGEDAMLHLHLVASVSGFSVDVYEADNLDGLHFDVYANALLRTTSTLHPVHEWQDGFLIGNKQYVVKYQPDGLDTPDNASYQRHALKVPDNYEVTGITTNDEYAVIACAKICDDSSRNYKEGILAFWDGTTEGMNFFIECPQGEPEGIFTYNNITYCFIDGALYAYTGTKELIKVRTMRETQSEFTREDDSTRVLPNIAAVRRGIMLMAYPSFTTLNSLRFGIYSWGCLDKNYPNSLAYSYKLDADTPEYQSENLKLCAGCVYSFGDTMYYGWAEKDGNNVIKNHLYKVDNYSEPAENFKFESLAFDNSVPRKQKMALRVCVAMRKLPAGTTIIPKWKINDGEWQYGEKSAQEGDEIITAEINRRFYDIQFGFDGTNENGTEPPVILSVSLDFRAVTEERKID